ncbi:thiaminase II [Chryseobacterium sp. MYb264]|uniref:thiaminase II n=1 Tax=Chryseobacterium sp. MYb264 TaxID=2745153 RepID=UPI002E10BB5A|nr:thiaminase II [Chryseobacterium sp. MYb264]
MNWSETAWRSIEKIYQDIIEMPFIEELSQGTLEKQKFQFYIAQDSLYLEHFGRTLALIGSKAYDTQDALSFMRFAENAIVVENALHESYFKEFDISDKGILQPVCHHYIHFLRSTAAFESVEVAMAATLPCFWIYKRVGDHIIHQTEKEDHPFESWIETYGGEEFGMAVEKAISICNKAAENTTPEIRNRMKEAFITASRLEFLFWQAAYDLNVWL